MSTESGAARSEHTGYSHDLSFNCQPALVIPKRVFERVREQVEEGIRLMPYGGAEIGGLFLGPPTGARSGGRDVFVHDVVPLAVQYARGPRFEMSQEDLGKLEQKVASLQSDGSKVVVGFYRSRTRGDAELRPSDREILDTIENGSAQGLRCCVMLAPVSICEMATDVVMRGDGGWGGVWGFRVELDPLSVVEYKDQAAGPLMIAPSALVEQPPAAFSDEPEVSAESVDAAIPEVEAASLKMALEPAAGDRDGGAGPTRTWMYVVGGLIAIAGAAGVYQFVDHSDAAGGRQRARARQEEQAPSADSSPAAAPLRMGFAASREGPVWKLSRDQSAFDVLKSAGATLSITDGGRQQQMTLSPEDLAGGSIFYTPQTGDLLFSLQRIERSGAATEEEHVRVLGAVGTVQKAAAPITPPTHDPNPAQANSAQANSKNVAPVVQNAQNAPAITPQIVPPPVAPAPKPVRRLPSDLAARLFTSAKAAKEASAAVSDLDPPPAVTAIPAPQSTSLAIPGPGIAEQAVVREATPAPIPAPPSQPAAAVTQTATQATTTFVGAKAIQKVVPQPPVNVQDYKTPEVQVTVQIDSRGKVTKVTPIGRTLRNTVLMDLAVRAAVQWVFEPARENGQAVASESILTFKF